MSVKPRPTTFVYFSMDVCTCIILYSVESQIPFHLMKWGQHC